MANEKTPVVWDDTAKKHRPLGSGEKMDGLSASSIISSQSGNLITTGSDGLAYATGSGIADPAADNLLEATSAGKLKLDVDRLAEWLDGHPQDAAVLADAIKVVSEDSGNVISAGSDNGAYLSSAALSAVIAGMSSAQLQTLLASLADGETVVASGGKLVVDPTSAPKAKLQAITTALRKVGGGLSVDSGTGKLVVDFASMDPAIMRNVVLSMVQTGGGIAVDQNGQLFVDFDNMPTDKFEALLKSLKMQVPLSANMNMYVDGANGSDTIIDGRGTEAKPFKTITACARYATQNYAVGAYTLAILVKPGTYIEQAYLPSYTHTSGRMVLRAYDYANPPLLTNTNNNTVISCSGVWSITRFDVASNVTASNDGLEHFLALVSVSGGGSLDVYGCSFNHTYVGAAPTSGHTYLRSINIDGFSVLNFRYMQDYATSIEVVKGNATTAEVLFIQNGSQFRTYSTNNSDYMIEFLVKGDFTNFTSVGGQSTFYIVGGGTYTPRFVVPSGASAVGKCYYASGSSGISIPSNQTLPGTIEGTVDSSTYSWYKGGTLQ